uniref:Uncharacterized protein n=1 Tax=Coccolithus braarudii TaxID=221442 RepID=A0A7S0Q2N3_9EUKA
MMQHAPSPAASRAAARLLADAPKGFGKKLNVQPKKKVLPSTTQVRRTKAADDFDKLKASGAPEYLVSIRTVGEKTSEWMPVGGIAVPRSSSEDAAVSMAIFNNEDELLKGAFRNFPRLKVSEDRFEYGFRLKDFPEDPIKVASKEKTEVTTNPLMQWFNSLDSPLNK